MRAALQDWFPLLFNFDLLDSYGWRILDGVRITALVVVGSCLIGFVLAILICRARLSRNRLLSGAALAYVTFFRGTPLLCQLYIAYYGAGQVRGLLESAGLWWIFKDAFPCCILTFALNTAAYQAEILRGALGAVARGQTEAATALGLSSWRTARHVVWPQAALAAIRPMGNELISMIKSSALAAIVTLLDLMGETRFIFARTFDFSAYLYAAILYLLVTEAIRRAVVALEAALSRHLADAALFRPADAAAPEAVPAFTH